MKTTIFILISTMFSLLINKENYVGQYSYKSRNYYEIINLKENSQFVYNYKNEFITYEIKGNYKVNHNSLVLDSNPQRDKIVVKESNRGNKKNSLIIVRDKESNLLNYHIYLILLNDEIICLKDQWDKTKIKNQEIRGFYIVDTKGLKSPIYLKKSEFSNHFEVLFETKRVFENEIWLIENEKIKSKGMDGEYQNYYLKKND